MFRKTNDNELLLFAIIIVIIIMIIIDVVILIVVVVVVDTFNCCFYLNIFFFFFIFFIAEIHKIDTLNIMVHVLNSIIMLIDLAIVGHPIKLSHVYFTTGIGLAYAIFTGIYFLAGGTDR